MIPRERLRHLAREIHALGPRPLFELFVELEAGADLAERLERYADCRPMSSRRLALGICRRPQSTSAEA